MKNNKTFQDIIAPIVVLVAIAFVATAALAVTYGITKPIIDENTAKAADETRTLLLADADSFTAYDGDLVVVEEGKVFVTDCYVADNGAGMVATIQSKSFGGLLTMMVGIDADGAVTGISITDHADTPGLGTKDFEASHLDQYKGLTEVTQPIKKDANVKYISGATVSGNAVHQGVGAALQQFEAMGGVN